MMRKYGVVGHQINYSLTPYRWPLLINSWPVKLTLTQTEKRAAVTRRTSSRATPPDRTVGLAHRRRPGGPDYTSVDVKHRILLECNRFQILSRIGRHVMWKT